MVLLPLLQGSPHRKLLVGAWQDEDATVEELTDSLADTSETKVRMYGRGLVGKSLSVDSLQVPQLCAMMQECSEGVREGEEKGVPEITQALFHLLSDTTR